MAYPCPWQRREPGHSASRHSQRVINTAPLGCCMLRCWRAFCFERLSECMLAIIRLSARYFPVNSKFQASVVPRYFACVAPRTSKTFLSSAGRRCNVSQVGCAITSRKSPPLARLFPDYVTLCSVLEYGKASSTAAPCQRCRLLTLINHSLGLPSSQSPSVSAWFLDLDDVC